MLVKNLVPWSGHDFSYLPGDNIELPDEVAKARIKAGLCAKPDPGAGSGDNVGALKKQLAEQAEALEATKTALAAEQKAHAETIARHEAIIAELTEPAKGE